MAPRPTYDSPSVQLRHLAVAARRRGMSFEEFWVEAVRDGATLIMTNHPAPPPNCILWPTDRNDRNAWKFGITSTKQGWRRAYERVATPERERAMTLLGESIGALDQVAEERADGEIGDAMQTQGALVSAA